MTLGIILGAVIIVVALIVVLSRRSRLRSWRFGIFYEIEEKYKDKNDDD